MSMNLPGRFVLRTGLALCTMAAMGADITHIPSGIRFPEQIEQHFTRGHIDPAELSSQSITLNYLYADGTRVVVKVYPAPADAKGPTILDGGSKTGATPSFMKEFASLKTILTGGDTSFHVVSENRFQAAPHKKGPIGMTATLHSKQINHDVLLCERNGFFVSFTVTYPASRWITYSTTYTDVAHFLGWPLVTTNKSEATPYRKQQTATIRTVL